jgi:hypothetical protein
MMNTRVTVGRGRTLVKYKLGTTFAFLHGAPKDILLFPHLQHIVVRLRQIQAVMLGKSLAHFTYYLPFYFYSLQLTCKGKHFF